MSVAEVSVPRVERWLARCIEDEHGCLIWPGATSDKGYALVAVRLPDGTRGNRKLHRIVYEHLVGPIPPGLVIDHVHDRGCRSRACCNVEHLEPVTQQENVLRGDGIAAHAARRTHCPSGHEYTQANTYLFRGSRYCRSCKRDRAAS
jgi:hypothetical protein